MSVHQRLNVKASIFASRIFLSNHKDDIEDSDLRERRARTVHVARLPCGGDLKRVLLPRKGRKEREREKESGSGRDGDPLRQDIGQDLAVDSRSFPSDSRALFLPIPRPDRHKTQVTPVFMPVVFTPVATPSRVAPRRSHAARSRSNTQA